MKRATAERIVSLQRNLKNTANTCDGVAENIGAIIGRFVSGLVDIFAEYFWLWLSLLVLFGSIGCYIAIVSDTMVPLWKGIGASFIFIPIAIADRVLASLVLKAERISNHVIRASDDPPSESAGQLSIKERADSTGALSIKDASK